MPEPRLTSKDDASARTELAAAWLDAAEAGFRYYARLGGLALALAETLVPAIGELRPTVRLPSHSPDAPAREAPSPGVEDVAQTIVIEAAAGQERPRRVHGREHDGA